MSKKITIIGGGISGLYLAYKLSTSSTSNPTSTITILEKNNYLGGRIFTHREQIENQSVSMECGAGRLGSRDAQKLLWNLLDSSGLTDKVVQISTTSNTFDALLQRLKRFTDEQLMNSTITQLIGDIDPNIFGYDAEFNCMNALYARDYIQRHFIRNHYYLQGGLDQIVKAIVQRLKNVRILTGSYVYELNQTYCRLRDGTLIQHDYVYITIPPRNYLNLRFPSVLKDTIFNLNTSVQPVALCRLFVGVRNSQNLTSPFGDVGKLVHSGPIRMFFVLKTYPTFTSCQIYTDSKWAKWWNEQGDRTDVIASELQKIFNVNIEVTYHRKAFWRNGVHVWKKGYSNKSINQKPFSWVSICGEAVSKESQGWIEGALESVESVL